MLIVSTLVLALVFFTGIAIGALIVYLLKSKPGPRPQPDNEGVTIMSRFKLPADQPDFDIELTVAGKDSEGNAVAVPERLTVEVDNSNTGAIEGTVKSSALSEDGKTLRVIVGAHVGSPSPDLGVIGYKAKGADGTLLGAGSDEFLIGTGAFAVASIASSVPFTPEPETPPVV